MTLPKFPMKLYSMDADGGYHHSHTKLANGSIIAMSMPSWTPKNAAPMEYSPRPQVRPNHPLMRRDTMRARESVGTKRKLTFDDHDLRRDWDGTPPPSPRHDEDEEYMGPRIILETPSPKAKRRRSTPMPIPSYRKESDAGFIRFLKKLGLDDNEVSNLLDRFDEVDPIPTVLSDEDSSNGGSEFDEDVFDMSSFI